MSAKERNITREAVIVDRLFTAEDDEVQTDVAVVIEDGRFQQILPATEVREDEFSTISTYRGATAMPGLVDAHAHISLPADGRSYEQIDEDPDELLALVSVRNMDMHLESGVTTIRDLGARDEVTFRVREGQQRGYFGGPRLLLAGRPITTHRGHFAWCGSEADGPDEVRRAVRELVADGADAIKVMASGGGSKGIPPYLPSFHPDELRMIAETAHGLGRLATAHCRARESMVYAAQAGFDCIEHGDFLIPSANARAGSGPAAGYQTRFEVEYDPAVTEEIAKAGTFVSVTLQSSGYHRLQQLRAQRASGDPLSAEEESLFHILEERAENKVRMFGSMARDGIADKLVVSTDAGCFVTEFGKLRYGIGLAIESGFSVAQALRAVTSVAAANCGIGEETGTVAQGLDADLLVVDGDPFSSLDCLTNVRAVYRAGALVAGSAAA